jgi:isopenicillin N synthase-like dioxygenase
MLSGGRLRSPVHRVVLPDRGDRASFVFFFYPKCVEQLPFFARGTSWRRLRLVRRV